MSTEHLFFERFLPGALSVVNAGAAAAVLWRARRAAVPPFPGRSAVLGGFVLLVCASFSVFFGADPSGAIFSQAVMSSGLVLLAAGISAWMSHAGARAGNGMAASGGVRAAHPCREGAAPEDDEQARFKLMVEGAGEEIYLVRSNGDLLYVNEAAARSLGYSVDEMLSLGVAGFDPLFGPNFEQHFAELKQRDLPSFETHHIAKDGRTVIKELKSVYLNINGGEYVCGYGRDVTERKIAESDIRNSNIRFQALLQSVPDMVSVQDTKGAYVYVNRVFEDRMHVSAGQVLGRRGQEVLPGDLAEESARSDQEVLSGGDIYRAEQVMQLDGQETFLETIKTPIRNEAGHVVGLVGVSRDITERKKMEQTLSQAKRDWENTFDTITDMITIHDRDFNIIRANRAAATILGLPWIELKRAKCYEYFHGAACPPTECPSCESLQSGRPSISERFEPHLGKYLEVRTIPRIDEAGRVSGLIHVVRDVSERRKTEDMIRAIAEKVSVKTGGEYFREIAYFLSHELGMEYAFVGEIVEGGRRAETLALYGQGAFIQQFKYDLDGTPCARVTQEGIVFHRSGVSAMFPQNDRLASMQVESYGGMPLFSSGGALIGVLVVMGTGKKGPDDERKARLLLQILAARAAMEIERMRLETQLREAQRMEVIGSLAGGVAHEVRNPLNAIMALTDALAQDLEGNAEFRLYVEHMRSQVDRLGSLMNDLLELGKPVDTANLQVQSMVDICRASVDAWRLSPVSAGRPVHISAGGQGAFEVRGDSKKLQQVFINLLDNASQHSRKDGPLRIDIDPDGIDRMQISVSDEGAGIPAELLPRVFDAFFTTRRGGTGLGLSIVRHIIEKHGGSITLRNNDPLPGCTAVIILPREERPRE